VVECGGLENRYRCKPIEGSNPSSSAIFAKGETSFLFCLTRQGRSDGAALAATPGRLANHHEFELARLRPAKANLQPLAQARDGDDDQ
jgi:hypothetical protein